jgi:hypothetical protein
LDRCCVRKLRMLKTALSHLMFVDNRVVIPLFSTATARLSFPTAFTTMLKSETKHHGLLKPFYF